MLATETRRRLSLLLMGALLIAYFTPVQAEVVLQGVPGTLTGAITISGNVPSAQVRGTNLFQSFSVFNILRAGTQQASGLVVPAQESVTFTPPTVGGVPVSITNVINRVTGGTSAYTLQKSSLIDGPLNSLIPGANFWFINPNGIIFGSNAVLPTTGSFHASTADYIKLADLNTFAATPLSSEVLTVAAPSAFGFLNANPAGIQVVNAFFQGTATKIMQVPAGRTLSLVGGTINVGTGNTAQGFLLAPAGRLNLVSVASAGEATFDPTKINGPLNTGPDSFKTREINVDNFTRLGDITIKGGATGTGQNPATSVVDAKEIFIRSGNLTVDNSLVVPGIWNDLSSQFSNIPVNGGRIEVRAAGDVTITGNRLIFGSLDSGIQARAGATAPPLTTLRDVPDISVEAGGTLTVSGLNAIVRSDRFVQGTSSPVSFGNVAINADRVAVLGGGEISAVNRFSGKGGDLTVNAREIVLDGVDTSQVLLTGGFTGLTTQSNFHPAYPGSLTDARLTNGQAGTLTVTADTLTIKRGANITADNFAFGKAGDMFINVRDLFLSRDGATTGAISTQSTLAGDSGNITIRAADRIELNEGQISATTNSSGNGGFVDVRADKSLTISGANGGIISLTAPPPKAALDAFAARVDPFFRTRFNVRTVRADGSGDFALLVTAIEKQGVDLPDNAGWLDVLGALNKPPFSVTAVSDLIPGDGGQISVTTPSLVMNAGTRMDSSTLWDGNAGQIVGKVGNLTVNDGAQIRSQSGGVAVSSGQPSVGFGRGGSVSLTADDSILITGSNSAVSTNTFGNGDGGSISLTAANAVTIQNGGIVSANSGGTLAGQQFSGTGLAGDITITAGDQIQMNSGSVSTRAITADGGNITLNAPNLIQLTNSQVTTSVESGVGGGGNITIDPQALILNDSKILANAFGGPGGNINITADVFLVNSGQTVPTSFAGIVEASSALSTPGTINIQANFTNVTGSVTLLPETPLKATELLRASCAARFAGGKTSSLVLAGRGGVPLQPGGLLPSPLYEANGPAASTTGTRVSGYDQSLRFSLLGSKDSVLNHYTLLPNAKCAL